VKAPSTGKYTFPALQRRGGLKLEQKDLDA
jgi:hypothetical protein